MSEVRRFPVGMSLEALASAWARQENAPHGSVVEISNEISGRLRGGVPWTLAQPDGLMMAMVVRPTLPPAQEGLLWLVVSLAASVAVSDVSGQPCQTVWPDSVVGPDGDIAGSTNVTVQLGPGRIEHAVLAVRLKLSELHLDDSRREPLLDALANEMHRALGLLTSDALQLVDEFTASCSVMDQNVKVSLLPRGNARGKVVAIDPNGDLVLESSTGMLERVMATNLRSVETVSGDGFELD